MTTAVRHAPAYPRPPLVFQHRDLFREPAYENGQPYADEDEDDEPATITP